MSKHGTDEQGWPLVPCDPAAIPKGYEAMRMGWPTEGESSLSVGGGVFTWEYNVSQYESPRLIIRPIPKPIRLPLAIVPSGWWVCRDMNGNVFVHETSPTDRVCNGQIWPLPPWIAAQLPQEWHELPWDQSAVQQEGGEG